MKELQSIVDTAVEAERRGRQILLATVVHVEGSTYRRPGAHLLVTEEGRYAGSISGGRLERDLVERARALTKEGAPALVTYNTTDDDLIAGFGAGCRGIVQILSCAWRGNSGGASPWWTGGRRWRRGSPCPWHTRSFSHPGRRCHNMCAWSDTTQRWR